MDQLVNLETLKELRDQGKITDQEFEDRSEALYEKTIDNIDRPAGAKSGIWYVVLAWFLGTLGVHNFYAGYFFSGLVMLILTITSPLFLFIPLIVTAIWALLDLLLVNKDAHGVPFTGDRNVILILRIAAVVWLLIALYYAYVNGQFSYGEYELVPVEETQTTIVSE